MADEDDLYADLYSEDVGNTSPSTSTNHADADHVRSSTQNAPPSSAKPSFIPPAPSSAPFIPPAPQQHIQQQSNAYYAGSNDVHRSSIASGSAPIETAPMTNTDQNRREPDHDLGDKPLLPHEMPDEGKLFVGGLNWDTTDAGLKQYFSQFGKVDHCLIMRDPNTNRSRGFAFLTFNDPKAVNSVMVKEHYLDGKMIDPKRAIPRQENVKTAKCFVGGVPSSTTSESFRQYFNQFGNVLDSTLMMDRETQKPRGYGFVTYDNDSTVERLLQMGNLTMDGKMIEVKRATPRNADGNRKPNVPRNDYSSSRNQGGDMSSMGNMGMGDASSMGTNPMAAMMMNNPMFAGAINNQNFDPTAMAQFFQQPGFNPMAFQQMMMGGWGAGNPMMNAMGGMGFGGGMFGGSTPMSPSQGQSNRSTSQNNTNLSSRDSPSQNRDTRGSADGRRNAGRPGDASPPTHSSSTARDYQRERSPERYGRDHRRSSSRENRWS